MQVHRSGYYKWKNKGEIIYFEEENKAYLLKALRELHSKRQVEFNEAAGLVQILPPGSKALADFASKRST